MQSQEGGGHVSPTASSPEPPRTERSPYQWAVFAFTGLSASIIGLLRYYRDGTVMTLSDGWQPAVDHPTALWVDLALNGLAVFGFTVIVVEAVRVRRRT